MIDREKILRFYRASGEAELAARLLDGAEAALRQRRYKVTDFLDPHGYGIAQTVMAHCEHIILSSEGGYPNAERVRAAFSHEDYRGNVDFAIAALAVTWDVRFYQLSHRDVLGALMGLGIKREVLGDIIMTPEGCQMVVDAVMAAYLKQQLTKIGAATVSIAEIPLEDLTPKEEKVKEIRATVASLRVDVVAAAGYGVSRTRMAEEIAADKIRINWQSAKSASQMVKAGDVISLRGRGRVEITEIVGQTKKGRISLVLKRFI